MKPLQEWWASLDRSRQGAVGVGALALVLVGVVVAATLAPRGTEPVAVASAPVATTVASDALTTTLPIVEPKPTEVGVPTIKSLKELKERFGDPPTANRGRIRIPGLGIDAPIGVRSVPASLEMPAPTGPADVVLYDFPTAPHYGGMPGRGGNAVLSGHVDYSFKLPYAEANYTGLAVFALLRTVQPNSDQIQLQIDGRTLTYTVQWVRSISAEHGNWGDLLARDIGADAITIVTCDGAFNPVTQEYADRIVVRAVRSAF